MYYTKRYWISVNTICFSQECLWGWGEHLCSLLGHQHQEWHPHPAEPLPIWTIHPHGNLQSWAPGDALQTRLQVTNKKKIAKLSTLPNHNLYVCTVLFTMIQSWHWDSSVCFFLFLNSTSHHYPYFTSVWLLPGVSSSTDCTGCWHLTPQMSAEEYSQTGSDFPHSASVSATTLQGSSRR